MLQNTMISDIMNETEIEQANTNVLLPTVNTKRKMMDLDRREEAKEFILSTHLVIYGQKYTNGTYVDTQYV